MKDEPPDNVHPIRGSKGNGHDKHPPPRSLLLPLDLTECLTRTCPPRSWVVRNWIPRHAVTLLAGTGGVGKSLLAQQIATAVCANDDWLGEVETPGSVLYLAAEEEPEELWRRQIDICRAMGIPMAGIAPDLLLDGRMGLDNALCEWHGGKIAPTRLMVGVREWLGDMASPQLLIVDNVAHVFNAGEGGENDRSKVGAFINMLAGVGRDFDVGVLLLGHPGKNVGSQYSGSTAWSDLARSRLFLGRQSKDGPLRLIRPKGNYVGNDDDGVPLEWENGAFGKVDYRETPLEAMANAQREIDADDCVLRGLDHFTALKTATSEKPRAGSFLPRLMLERHRNERFTPAELGDALVRLLESGAITPGAVLPWRDDYRKQKTGLVRGGVRIGADQSATGPQPGRNDDESDVRRGHSQANQDVDSTEPQTDPHLGF
jgi:hypothetical protein